ncbi:hypothetical protein [Niveispirillum sp. BGYR6]|uniref:hypothetical protein n=1 Tax=Niveispirillum sp. BGYR6 TaxID=2971249 RepID=UPI0022B99ECF|nr:hypothetical protein [Niveispirillum sp. BGYR6]MDG5497935.1 hypothetical protein [Niveispirillum sp. BGYR6]
MSAAMPFRWLWYLLRVLFCSAYAVVAFFSKPGARWIVVAALTVAAWLLFPWVQQGVHGVAVWFNGNDRPETILWLVMLALSVLWLACLAAWIPGRWALLILLLLAWWLCIDRDGRAWVLATSAQTGHLGLYASLIGAVLVALLVALWALAKMLALVLGTFPPPAWPLRPRAVLKARNRVIAPVPVAVAVPRLRPSAPRPPHELHAALPPEVAALLTPRHPPALP